MKPAAAALFIVAGWLLTACGPETGPIRISGATMGTTWSLQIADKVSQTQATELQTRISHQLDTLEKEISHWRADSALSLWNRSALTDWQPLPASLVEMVAVAQKVGNETHGALDVTAAPLVELWGFGPTPRRESAPSEAEIQAVLDNVGWHHLQVSTETGKIRKNRPEVAINVSSVAEGYAMDALIPMLRGAGIDNFLLEIGGEVAAFGRSPERGPWQVGIQAPEGGHGEALESLPLTGLCIATSGTYRHRYEKDSRTYAHIMDPRTGHPVEHRLVSVSVIHEKAILADAYATALMVLGPEKGRKVAEKLHLRTIWLEEK